MTIKGIFRHLKTGNHVFDIGPFSQRRPNIHATDDEIKWHLKYLERIGALKLLFTSEAGAVTVDYLTAKGKTMMADA